MSDISRLIDDLRDTAATIERLRSAIEGGDGHVDILRINMEALEKRREDLTRRLNYQLRAEHADFVEYKIVRSGYQHYPAKAVASSITNFQELVTSIFDALKSTPKKRYRPSAESVELSTMDFSAAAPGSVVMSFSIPNERLLLAKTELDRTFEYVFAALGKRTQADFRELVRDIGIASVSKIYSWAATSAEYGISTQIRWGKTIGETRDFEISSADALEIKEVIEATSEEDTDFPEYECILEGIDGSTSYFHIKTFDGLEMKGGLSDAFPAGEKWTTNVSYKARLRRAVTTKYATGEERAAWTLISLEPADSADNSI